jgi:hypothetical protein
MPVFKFLNPAKLLGLVLVALFVGGGYWWFRTTFEAPSQPSSPSSAHIAPFTLQLPKGVVAQQHKVIPILGLTIDRAYHQASGQAFVVVSGLKTNTIRSLIQQAQNSDQRAMIQQQLNGIIGLISAAKSAGKAIELTELSITKLLPQQAKAKAPNPVSHPPPAPPKGLIRTPFSMGFHVGQKPQKHYKGEIWVGNAPEPSHVGEPPGTKEDHQAILMVSYHDTDHYQPKVFDALLVAQSFPPSVSSLAVATLAP